MNRAL